MTEIEELKIDIKRRLNSYRDLRAEQLQLQEELRQLEIALSTPAGSNLSGMPRGPGVSNPVERMVMKKLDLEERYLARLDALADAQRAIENMIESLEPAERRLARYRYIDGLTWEEVCDKICYSWKQTHRIHGRILDKLVAAELKK